MIMVVVLENNDFSKKSKMNLKDSEISILPIVLWKTTEMPPLYIIPKEILFFEIHSNAAPSTSTNVAPDGTMNMAGVLLVF